MEKNNLLYGSRNINLDLLRIIAILSVVMVHCSANFVYSNNVYEFAVGNFFDSISRFGVPIFAMVSGALMINKKAKDVLLSAKNILILTFIWSSIYAVLSCVVNPLIAGKGFDFYNFVWALVLGNYHMWYLYMLVGLYIITPFLSKFVNKGNKRLILFYILISLSTSFIKPILVVLSGYSQSFTLLSDLIDKFNLGFFSGYISYYLIGWYIVNIGFDKTLIRRIIYLLGVVSLTIVMLVTYITKDYENMYSNENIFVFLYSAAIFLFIYRLNIDFGEKSKKIIVWLSKLSFGVYIVHPIIQSLVEYIFKGFKMPILYLIISVITIYIVTLIICFLISKTPLLKRLIRM